MELFRESPTSAPLWPRFFLVQTKGAERLSLSVLALASKTSDFLEFFKRVPLFQSCFSNESAFQGTGRAVFLRVPRNFALFLHFATGMSDAHHFLYRSPVGGLKVRVFGTGPGACVLRMRGCPS